MSDYLSLKAELDAIHNLSRHEPDMIEDMTAAQVTFALASWPIGPLKATLINCKAITQEQADAIVMTYILNVDTHSLLLHTWSTDNAKHKRVVVKALQHVFVDDELGIPRLVSEVVLHAFLQALQTFKPDQFKDVCYTYHRLANGVLMDDPERERLLNKIAHRLNQTHPGWNDED